VITRPAGSSAILEADLPARPPLGMPAVP